MFLDEFDLRRLPRWSIYDVQPIARSQSYCRIDIRDWSFA